MVMVGKNLFITVMVDKKKILTANKKIHGNSPEKTPGKYLSCTVSTLRSSFEK